mgnify:CR=1 FL=1
MRKFTCHLIKRLLAFMGIFLGFSAAVTAQYGVVENHWRVMGDVKAENCAESLKDTRVRITAGSIGGEAYVIGEAYADSNGRFVLGLYDPYLNSPFTIEVSDPLRCPPRFKDTVFVIPTEDLGFISDGSSHWTKNYYNRDTIHLRIPGLCPSEEGTPPAPGIADTTAEENDQLVTLMVPEDTAALIPEPDATEQEMLFPLPEAAGSKDEPLLFPNPGDGRFTVQYNDEIETWVQVSIFDNRMQLLEESAFFCNGKGSTFRVDVSLYPSGVYFVRLMAGSRRTILRYVRL